jgi:hypothetical protein
VQPGLIKRLYRTDARGIVDEELIDKVGYALLDRCETIRRVTERRCPQCAQKLEGIWRGPRERTISCPACGWESTWAAYHSSYKRRRIHGGRAYPFFLKFLADFPKCRTPQEKMLAIDRLIHAVHEGAEKIWTSPAASNLIEGKRAEVVAFLDRLAYGDQTGTAREGVREDYRERMAVSAKLRRKRREAQKRRHERQE